MKLPLQISGRFEVPASIRSGDALHSFNRRKSDDWGGYMLDGNPPENWKKYVTRSHGSINENLIKAYQAGYNPDVKIDKINIKGWVVEWSATIFVNNNGKAYVDVSSRGSFGGDENDAKTRGWLQIKKGGLSNSIEAADENGKSIEPWAWLYDLNYKGSGGFIRQWFYKRTNASDYPPHSKSKESSKDGGKKTPTPKLDVKVDYIFGDEIAAKVATDALGLKRYSDASYNSYSADDDALTKMVSDSKGFSKYYAQPTEILNGLQSYKGKLKDKTILLSTGLLNLLTYQKQGSANWKKGISSIRKQIKFFNEEGAYVTILGLTGRRLDENGNAFIYGKNRDLDWGTTVSTIDVPSWNKWLDNIVNIWNGETADGDPKFEYYPEQDSFANAESFIKKKYPDAKLAKSKTGKPKSPGEYTINMQIEFASASIVKESPFDDKQSYAITYYPLRQGGKKFAFAGSF